MSDEPGRITLWSYTPKDGNPRFFLPLPNGELKEISREEAKQVPGRWMGRNRTIIEPEEDPEPEEEKNNKG